MDTLTSKMEKRFIKPTIFVLTRCAIAAITRLSGGTGCAFMPLLTSFKCDEADGLETSWLSKKMVVVPSKRNKQHDSVDNHRFDCY